MSKDLEERQKHLEQNLARQLELVKVESGDWLKIGGVVLAGSVIAMVFLKSRKKRKNRSIDDAIEVLEREGLLTSEIEKKLTGNTTSTFWPSMGQRLLVLGLAYAKEKFLPNLFNAQSEDAKVEETDR